MAKDLMIKLVDANPEIRTLALALCLALTSLPDVVDLPFDQVSVQRAAVSFLDDDDSRVRVVSCLRAFESIP